MLRACVVFIGLFACVGSPAGLPADALPRSTSTLEIPPPEVTITVGPYVIEVDGKHVIDIDDLGSGDVDPALLAVLQARARDRASAAARSSRVEPFRGAASIEIQRTHDVALFRRVLNTTVRAGFARPWVVVADPVGQRRGIKLTVPEVGKAAASAAAASGAPATGEYANPRVDVDPDKGFVVHAHDKVVDPGPGLELACPQRPCQDAWPTVELNRLARRLKLDHPRDRAIIVAPKDELTVQTLVTTLDATRDDRLTARGARELFPEAMLAVESR